MNPANGEVVLLTDDQQAQNPEVRDWVKFELGEVIEVKGIKFKVHDVSNQRLVLKFTK